MATLRELKLNERYIYRILSAQHVCRVKWYDPKSNPLEEAAAEYWNTITNNGTMKLGDIDFPDIRWFSGWYSWPDIYFDSMILHTMFDDDYCLENRQMIESVGGEGPYMTEKCYIKPGDVVIDAGAYIGDFSAVASKMGGIVYAFEPSSQCLNILNDVAARNNFCVVNKALGNVNKTEKLNIYEARTESFISRKDIPLIRTEDVEIVRLDDYVKEHGIQHVDFIKADIEGYENNLLLGAEETIKTFHPSLALRTYHNEWDKEELTNTILKFYNGYNIEYGTKTLYATDEKRNING